jgi:hypothetical protein
VKFTTLLLALYFFVGSFFPHSDWEELPKLANLMEHYQEHRQQSGTAFSVWDFINLHYIHPEKNQGDHHHNLPFFQHAMSFAPALIPHFQFALHYAPEAPVNHRAEHRLMQAQNVHRSIFQPPKV